MVDSNFSNHQNDFDEALRQFLDAHMRGEKPDIDEFVNKFPEFEGQIRQKVHSFQKINSLFDTILQTDKSEFGTTATGVDLVGQKIVNFEIVEMIGAGGMGVVYLARDTRLDRPVAIKSMPPGLMDNSTARTRFQREAKLLASLSHPNIGVIHDIIEQEINTGYLVLEYVPGQTLAERITRGPLKLKEALTIALQIAEAMAAAHEHDVIHRDLKPGNIKITPDGRVKVLDFGLAKTVGGELPEKPTATTEPGKIIGTPAYMSPEQACGKPTDKRSDIWSFGCIMYEMLTGHLPFEGQTTAEILARIIEREPDWELLPQETPTNIRSLLRHCLEKNPHQRLQHIGDARIEISETLSLLATAPPVAIPAKSRRMVMIISTAIIIVLSGVTVWLISKKEIQPYLKEKRLVVLPFENLSPSEDDYFAAGMTDEITSRLAGIHGLGVISRQSAVQYKSREKGTQQIAKELNVDYILEGTIQRERPSDPNSKVRIRLQLIKTSDDTHLWTQNYDNDMSEVFRLQSEVAEQVAQALDITLLEPERKALASRPTENIEAYEYYLRGKEYYNRSFLESDKRLAVRMYAKAVELDPTFALAYAELSRIHARMYWGYHDRSDERLAMAKQAVDRAFELNPNLPQAHLALGEFYYRFHLDYDRALEQYAIVRKSQPNNSELLSNIGFIQRRQGKFEQALANHKRASELNPHYTQVYHVALTYMLLRKYAEAERYYDRVISLAPEIPTAYWDKAWLYLCWQGSTEKARAVLEKALENVKFTENPFVNLLVILDVYDRSYQEAVDRLSLKSKDTDDWYYFIPKALRYARIYGYMKKSELAKKYYDEARSLLEIKIQQRPEDGRFHSSLGIAYAGLGRKEDAIREGQRGVELLPVTKDASAGPCRVKDLARIYVMVGEFDAAIDQLESLLDMPSEMSINLLQLDPAWDPLHNHPSFIELLKSGNPKK